MGDPKNQRPVAAASGVLAKTPLLHLLIYALDRKLSGSIELLSPEKRAAVIVFGTGQPVKIRTSEPVAYLGGVLKELGYLTEAQLTRSLADLAKSKATRPTLHGELLVAEGTIDAAKLKAGLREQLARKIRHAAAMSPETAYAYYQDFDVLHGWGADSEGIDPVPLFWSVLGEHAPWEHVTAALKRMETSRLRLMSGADLARLRLGREELHAATTLRAHPMTISELVAQSRLNERTARLLAYLLLVTKQVDVLPAVAATTSTPPERPRTSATPPSSRTPRPKVTPSGSPASISKAPPVPMAVSKAPPARATITKPPPPPSTLAAELVERWLEITERAASIDRTDYFMMLDVSRDATHDDVEAAFFGLVKRWHPDRLPPELAPVRHACSRVFARMSEAHATLTDVQRRANYMRLVADGSGSPEMQATVAKVVEAATAFQKAEVCFRRNDLVQAETFCRTALADDPTQPDYLALFAWLVALKPENQEPAKALESIHMLERAIGMSDRCERAYFWRGMLLKRLGKNDAAFKDFRRAVELNPRNIDAAREVRLYNMRGGRRSSKPPPGSKRPSSPAKRDETQKGILGRLFKKT
jgi:tetratricopeptide (TPR) repeat protein